MRIANRLAQCQAVHAAENIRRGILMIGLRAHTNQKVCTQVCQAMSIYALSGVGSSPITSGVQAELTVPSPNMVDRGSLHGVGVRQKSWCRRYSDQGA